MVVEVLTFNRRCKFRLDVGLVTPYRNIFVDPTYTGRPRVVDNTPSYNFYYDADRFLM